MVLQADREDGDARVKPPSLLCICFSLSSQIGTYTYIPLASANLGVCAHANHQQAVLGCLWPLPVGYLTSTYLRSLPTALESWSAHETTCPSTLGHLSTWTLEPASVYPRATMLPLSPSAVDADELLAILDDSTAPTTPEGSLSFSPALRPQDDTAYLHGQSLRINSLPLSLSSALLNNTLQTPRAVRNICCVGAGFVGRLPCLR